MHALHDARSQITVGVDGSPTSLAALRWAYQQAVRRSAALVVLTAWPAPARPGTSAIAGEGEARAVATSAVQSVLGRGGRSVTVWVTHYPADPADALLRRARKAELVVVGPHSAHSVAEHLLGSVTERLLSEAACPVAVIHTAPESMSHRIVVGVDGSPAAEAALRWATEQALLVDAKVAAFLVWDWRPEYGVHPYGPGERAQEDHARAVLELTVARLPSDARSTVTSHVVRGDPGHVLLAAAEDADLVVVGNNRGGPLAERILGSVSRRLALTAEQPVVVTHAPAPPATGAR